MITYNDIYEAARKERYTEQLQKISKKFTSDVSTYLKEKKETTKKNTDAFSESVIKTKKQLENAITLFRELMLRRKKKILNLVLIATETGISRQDFDNMLELEKELFEDIMKCVEKSDKNLGDRLSGNSQNEEQKNDLIYFTEEITEFTDMTGKTMGPFKKGEIANLPKDIAQVFINDKKAKPITN
jgi:DNA replication initiation complex subunit (GINS family)